MARVFVFAALCATAAGRVTPVVLHSSCSEADESALLQSRLALWGHRSSMPTQRATFSPELDALGAVKQNKDGFGSILLSAKKYTHIVKREVIPGVQSAMLDIGDLLATQRSLVKQCDVELQARLESKEGLQHAFQQKRSEHKVCLAEESNISELVTGCLERKAAAQAECAQLDVSRVAKAVECDELRAGVDAAACTQASHAGDVCESYSACRLSTLARYEAAARAGNNKARDRSTRMLQATQAQCISYAVATSAADVESMLKQMEECDALTLDANVQTPDEMPPAMVCQDVVVYFCSDGLLELDVGSENETWSVQCGACAERQPKIVSAPRRPQSTVASAPASAMKSGTAEGFSAETATVASATEASRSLRERFTSWISSATELAQITMNPRHRSAVTISFIGIGAKTTSRPGTVSIGRYVVILVVLPLVALFVALLVTVVSAPPRAYSRASNDLSISPGGTISGSNLSTGQIYARGRGSLRPSLASPGKEKLQSSPRSVGRAVGLCPELNVPAGNECILGVPSLAGVVPGGVMLENIVDGAGRPLLSVGLSSAPGDGDCIMLAKKGLQELAYCETGSAVRAEGWAAKIFRWNGELFARLREENAEDRQRLAADRPSGGTSASSNISGTQKTYVILSATGPAWELRVRGNFREWNLSVEDGQCRVMAMVSPGADLPSSKPASGSYRLRLGPRADSCTVILALLAIERLLFEQGEVSPLSRIVRTRSFRDEWPSAS